MKILLFTRSHCCCRLFSFITILTLNRTAFLSHFLKYPKLFRTLLFPKSYIEKQSFLFTWRFEAIECLLRSLVISCKDESNSKSIICSIIFALWNGFSQGNCYKMSSDLDIDENISGPKETACHFGFPQWIKRQNDHASKWNWFPNGWKLRVLK